MILYFTYEICKHKSVLANTLVDVDESWYLDIKRIHTSAYHPDVYNNPNVIAYSTKANFSARQTIYCVFIVYKDKYPTADSPPIRFKVVSITGSYDRHSEMYRWAVRKLDQEFRRTQYVSNYPESWGAWPLYEPEMVLPWECCDLYLPQYVSTFSIGLSRDVQNT